MRVIPVPCLSDNYAYLVVADDKTCAVVDPSEAAPVFAAVKREGVNPTEIWLTHHHWDHVGGVKELNEKGGISTVLGSAYDLEHKRIECQTRGLSEGDELSFDGHTVELLDIPGHTLGAIAFIVDGNLFSGDTLFLGGCGRVFEGTMEMMKNSLAKLRDLPASTKVWCGHEYTASNLRYAKTVEPDNEAITDCLKIAEQYASEGRMTVPGSMEIQCKVNPFLRWDVPALAAGRDAVETFTALREGKDRF